MPVLRIGNSDAKVLKFQLYERLWRNPSGNRPPSEFDCEEIWKKKDAVLATLHRVSQFTSYLETGEMIKTKWISEKSNKLHEFNKFANVRRFDRIIS